MKAALFDLRCKRRVWLALAGALVCLNQGLRFIVAARLVLATFKPGATSARRGPASA